MSDVHNRLSPEMIQRVAPDATPEELLSQSGWFYLTEVFDVLDPEHTGKYKLTFKIMERMRSRGADPGRTMGGRKLGGRMLVDMTVFAPWYRQNPLLKVQKIQEHMGFRDFLGQDAGIFRLSEVCRRFGNHLPFSYSVLKRGADREKDCRQSMGVFKYDTTYLVELPSFEHWLRDQILS